MAQEWRGPMNPTADDYYKNWVKKNKKLMTLESIQKQKPEDNLILKKTHNRKGEKLRTCGFLISEFSTISMATTVAQGARDQNTGYESRWKFKEEFLAMRELRE